jgi:hypothetical protein
MDPASCPQRENDKVSDALDSIDESERVFTMNAFEGAKGITVLNGITGWGSSGRPKMLTDWEIHGEFGSWIQSSVVTSNVDPRIQSMGRLRRFLAGSVLGLRRGAGKCN